MQAITNHAKKLLASLAITVGSILALAPINGHAGFLGDTIGGTLNVGLSPLNYFFVGGPSVLPQMAVVTDPGVEFVSNNGLLPFNITATDVGNNELLISILNPNLKTTVTPAMTFFFQGMDFQPGPVPITSVVNDLGLAPIGLAWTANTITIDFAPLTLGGGTSTFSHYIVSAVRVPEPSTYLSLGGFLFALALFAHARKRKQASASLI